MSGRDLADAKQAWVKVVDELQLNLNTDYNSRNTAEVEIKSKRVRTVEKNHRDDGKDWDAW